MPTTAPENTTNAIEMLKSDHEKVKDLFRKFSEAGDRAHKTKQRLAEQIFHELEIHSRLEEEVFYPAVCASADKEQKELVGESVEEHHVVDLLIAELKQMTLEDSQYDAKMTVLCENVEHHIKEEEEEMLPDAQQKLGGQIESLGEQMMQRKQQLLSAAA